MRIGISLMLVVLGLSASAQSVVDSLAVNYANTITAADLEKHLTILASDEYEGRETGKRGQKRAAEYIKMYFTNLGIKPCVDGSYYQEVPLKSESNNASTIVVNNKEFKFIDDFFFWSGFEAQLLKDEEVVFAGYGIDTPDYNDYNGLDAEGKIVLVLETEPVDKAGNSLISESKEFSDWSLDWKLKREAAEKHGAKAMLVIKENYAMYMSRVKYWLETPGLRLDYEEKRGKDIIPTLFVGEKLANEMFPEKDRKKWEDKLQAKGKAKALKPYQGVSVNISKEKTEVKSENVLCYIEGSDPELKHELVVITAHYDHIGIVDGEINNGADDDGSGTVSALEIAEAFQTAKKDGNGPRRSILIMTVTGEEKGLLGSEWYAANPIFPLENTVCNLNIDMIGRVDEAHADDHNYIYIIGSDKLSTELHAISEDANETYTKMALDYTYNHPDDPNRFYYRSDHYNFAKNGIPVIFYFSGVHEDYHRPGDDVEKILFNKMENVVKLVFHTAWDVANRDKKLVVDVENEFTD